MHDSPQPIDRLPEMRWPEAQLQAYEREALNSVEAHIYRLARDSLAGAIPTADTRWSTLLVPWLWLAAE